MKRMLRLLMAALVCVGVFTLVGGVNPVYAANIASGTCGTCSWAIDSDGVLTISPADGVSGTLYAWNRPERIDPTPWYNYRNSIKKVVITHDVKAVGNGFTGFFEGLSACTEMDLSGLDTSEMTRMQLMFYNCSSLQTIDVSTFNTSSVTNMQSVFSGCSSLKSVDLSAWDTSHVTTTKWMFSNCTNLKDINLSNFDSSAIGTAEKMFNGCSSLQHVNLGQRFRFITKYGVNDIAIYKAVLPTPPSAANTTGKWIRLDGACGPYTPAELRDNYSSDMAGIWGWELRPCAVFSDDGTLSFIRPTSDSTYTSGSTGTVKSISGGEYTGKIYVVDETATSGNRTWSSVASQVKKVVCVDEITPKNTESWFEGFSGCTEMDLSNLDTSEVTKMTQMFKECSALTTIKILDKWNTLSLTNSNEMFYNCAKLVGGHGTTFDENKIDGTYAKADSENEKGYLTKDCKIEIITGEHSSDSVNGNTILGYNESGSITITPKIGYRIKHIRDNGVQISINSEEAYVYNIETAKEYHSVEVETEAIQYKIVAGNNQERIEKKTEDLEIKSDGPIEIFTGLMIDGKMLTKDKDYTVKKGSTIAIISKNYLDKLGQGEHSITFNYSNGSSPQGAMKISKTGITKTKDDKAEKNIVKNETENVEINNVKGETSNPKIIGSVNTGDKIFIAISTIMVVIALNILQIKNCKLTSRRKIARIEREKYGKRNAKSK